LFQFYKIYLQNLFIFLSIYLFYHYNFFSYFLFKINYDKIGIAVTQKMLKPQPVNNSSYRFTKIFSEDLIFATGLLLFPKDSFKPNRNSKDNILVISREYFIIF